jgi:NADP-dependent 3-hydroxy acid dehydrogenase YdfG
VLSVSRSQGIDVTDPAAPERIVEALGGSAPDILVNNAGTSFARSLDDLTDEDWTGQF